MRRPTPPTSVAAAYPHHRSVGRAPTGGRCARTDASSLGEPQRLYWTQSADLDVVLRPRIGLFISGVQAADHQREWPRDDRRILPLGEVALLDLLDELLEQWLRNREPPGIDHHRGDLEAGEKPRSLGRCSRERRPGVDRLGSFLLG